MSRETHAPESAAGGRRRGPPTAQPPAAPQPLTDAELAEVAAYTERKQMRLRAPRFQLVKNANTTAGGASLSPAPGVSTDLFRARLTCAVGTVDEEALMHLLHQAIHAVEGHDRDTAQVYNVAAALLTGIQPRNELEATLAVQMLAAHNLALAMARRALNTDRLDCLATYGNLTAKLMNVYTRQLEALARLRGQTGQQTVRVEHVTVEAGGQAVVGAVTTPRGRGDADRN